MKGGVVQEPRPASAEFKRDLWQAFAHSVRDNVMAEFAVQGLRLSGMVILARLLRPEDFGLLRILIIIGMFAMLVTSVGLPDALVQRKEITPEHESAAWWLSFATAGASAFLLYVGAPRISRMMAMPDLVVGIRLICLPVVLEGTAVISSARLRRRVKFRALAAADVVGEMVFLGVALLLVRMGSPRTSLAGGLAARYVAHALTIWSAEPSIPRGMPRLAPARDLARFSLSVLGASFTATAAANADYLLVGRLLGSRALGFYSVSRDLLRFVPDRLHRVAVRVIFPAFSRLQDDNHELARAYLNLFTYVARIALPFMACVALAAPEVVRAVYGPQWTPAAVPMRLLAGGLSIRALREGVGSIYYAKDYPSLDIYFHGTRLGLIVVTVMSLARAGLFGVSAGISVVESALSVVAEYAGCLLIGLKIHDLLAALVPELRVTVWCVLATMVGKSIAMLAGVNGPLALAAVAIPPALVFLSVEGSDVTRMLAKSFDRSSASASEA